MQLSCPIFRLKRAAKQMSRAQSIPMHQALDHIAKAEGFRSWSHLAKAHDPAPIAARILNNIHKGSLTLLAARPEHGKTTLALDILAEATRAGHTTVFFTLDYNEEVATRAIDMRGVTGINLDTSDDICAAHIIQSLERLPDGAIAVIDYLQLLDQKRSNPPLSEQMQVLKSFATRSGATLILLSQIDRSFDMAGRPMPGPRDIRLPNPLDLSAFEACYFLHDGELHRAEPELT